VVLSIARRTRAWPATPPDAPSATANSPANDVSPVDAPCAGRFASHEFAFPTLGLAGAAKKHEAQASAYVEAVRRITGAPWGRDGGSSVRGKASAKAVVDLRG
jgi:hypothetical protein